VTLSASAEPRTQRGEETATRILDAAATIFGQHGLAGTRVRDIANEAGVNVATLYIYFPSKQHLHEAVLERGLRPLIDILARFAHETDKRAATAPAIDAIMQHLAAHPAVPRLIYQEAVCGGELLERVVHRWMRPLEDMIETELRAGVMPHDEGFVPVLAAIFLHLTFGHFALAPLLSRLFGADFTAPEALRRQTQLVTTLARELGTTARTLEHDDTGIPPTS
jgi:AcrR family transcriptional regulator